LTAAHAGRQHGRHFVLFQPFSDVNILSTLTLFPGFDFYVLLSHSQTACTWAADAAALPSTPRLLRGLCQCLTLAPALIEGLRGLGFEMRSAATAYPDGRATYARDRRPSHALRLDFGRPGHPTQHIFHARMDTSDGASGAYADFRGFMDTLPNVVTLLRSAAFAFGAGGFNALETMITTKSTAIVEEDYCLPYEKLRSAGYYVRLQKSWLRAAVELSEHLPPRS
jgi:hypothetical protein